MKLLRRQFLHLAAGAAALPAVSRFAWAQTYPTRPMTMIVPFAAGGPQDVLGRLVAQRMSEILGQQIVVENIGGAGGVTGSKRVADAQPNGYTMGIGSVGTHAHNQTLYKRPAYDAVADFTPVALIAETPSRAGHAQGSAGQQLPGIRRLHQGEPGEDAIRLAGCGRLVAYRLCRAQPYHRSQSHPRALSRRRAGNAGSHRRPHRLPVRSDRHGEAPDRWPAP